MSWGGTWAKPGKKPSMMAAAGESRSGIKGILMMFVRG
jgi:hypothetical protein